MRPHRLVVRDVQVVKLRGVVVADESSGLLEMLRPEINSRGCAERVGLLAPRDERLPKLAADGLAAVQSEITGTRRQAELLVGPWRSKPLKRDRQAPAVEVLSLGIGSKPVDRNPRGARRIRDWNAFTVHGAKPAIR